MFKTVKNFLRGITAKPAAPETEHVVPVSQNHADWASFEVDPELAYRCRDRAVSAVDSNADALPLTNFDVQSAVVAEIAEEPAVIAPAPSVASVPAVESSLPESFSVSAESEPESDILVMSLAGMAPADVALKATVIAVSAATQNPAKRVPTQAKPKVEVVSKASAAKKTVRKPALKAAPKVEPVRNPVAAKKLKLIAPKAATAATPRRAAGLNFAKPWVFPSLDSHCMDDSVETVQLDLCVDLADQATA